MTLSNGDSFASAVLDVSLCEISQISSGTQYVALDTINTTNKENNEYQVGAWGSLRVEGQTRANLSVLLQTFLSYYKYFTYLQFPVGRWDIKLVVAQLC